MISSPSKTLSQCLAEIAPQIEVTPEVLRGAIGTAIEEARGMIQEILRHITNIDQCQAITTEVAKDKPIKKGPFVYNTHILVKTGLPKNGFSHNPGEIQIHIQSSVVRKQIEGTTKDVRKLVIQLLH